MKSLKRIICAILVAALGASLLTACGRTGKTQGEAKEQAIQNVKPVIASTEFDLVAAGSTEYFILTPDEPSKNEEWAASEVQLFFERATGARLEIKKESAADKAGKFISVGDTKASQEAGINPTHKELKYSGFIIRTVGDDCYIKGATDVGTRTGVYDWLYYCFNYECYYGDEIAITETKDLKLPAFEITYLPSFDLREPGGEYTWDDEMAYRMRFNPNAEIYVTDRMCHTAFSIIDPFTYDYTSDEYKEWFSDKMFHNQRLQQMVPAQLCYSNTEMREEFVKNLKTMLENTTDSTMILGMEDYNDEWCECEKCAAYKQKYGTDIAVMIPFMNYVQEEISKWYETEHPDKTPVQLLIFAYRTCEKAPAVYDEASKTYVPMDDEMKLHEDLGIYFAPVEASYAYPFESEVNWSVYENLQAWNCLTDTIYAWVYSTYPLHTMIMMDSLEVTQKNYKTLLENGATSIFDQDSGKQRYGNSGWTRVKWYVYSKLQYNINLNMEELIDNFFANYFDVAGDTMQDLFETDRQWARHLYGDLGATGNIFEDMLKTEYYPYPVMKAALDKIDQAYEDIEVYQESDPERYQQLHDRITLESLQYRYIIIELYSSEYTPSEYLDMKYQFKNDATRLGICTHVEDYVITDLWLDWGI